MNFSLRSFRAACVLLGALSLVVIASLRAHAAPLEPQNITLPSRKPSGDPDVDQIRVRYFTATLSGAAARDLVHPTIVLLPPLGGSDISPLMQDFARYLSERGINVAVMTMPYNGERWSKTQNRGNPDPGLYYASGDPTRNAKAFEQAASDVTTVTDWLLTQPGVDSSRLGVGGLSLGAIVTHIAMGRDERLGTGVAMLGSGDLTDLYHHGLFSLLNRYLHPSTRSPIPLDEAFRSLRAIDPLANVDDNRPRHVFMVEAARDIVIPPRDAQKLWNALGRPPIRWIDSSHYGLLFNQHGAEEAAWQYYRAAWGLNGTKKDPSFTPALATTTIKFGFILQEHAPNTLGFTPALTWQPLSLGSRSDHLPIAHLDLGITGRGPFVGAAATVTSYMDLGIASRIGRTIDSPRPYLGFHLTF